MRLPFFKFILKNVAEAGGSVSCFDRSFNNSLNVQTEEKIKDSNAERTLKAEGPGFEPRSKPRGFESI